MNDANIQFDRFVSAAAREPLRTAAHKFRDAVRAEEEGQSDDRDEGRRPLATPSAHEADRRATETMDNLRSRFEEGVLEAEGTPEQRRLWSRLTADGRDEFVARLFAPPVLGGFFGDEADTRRCDGEPNGDDNSEEYSDISSLGDDSDSRQSEGSD